MGVNFFDQFSLLHFSSGVLAYFWGLSPVAWFLLHLVFEIVENTPLGVYTINTYIWFWPGGKPQADSLLNSIGDHFFAILGYWVAMAMDQYFVAYPPPSVAT